MSTIIAEPAPELDEMHRVLNGRIPASVVTECTKGLPADERESILWAHAHYWDNELSLRQFGALIGYDSGTTMSRVFRGAYEGNRADVVAAIDALRERLDTKNRSVEMPWQATELGKEIRENCEIARKYQALVCGYGESQIGKTAEFREIEKEDREGTTLLFEVPPGATEGEFLAQACGRFSMSARSRTGELWLKLARFMRVPGMLVIIDEGARAGGERDYGGGNYRLLERLRWLLDTCHFGMKFCGTNTTRDQLQAKEHEKYLNQWNRRVLRKVQYPDLPSRKDLNVFSRYYGLDAATGAARLIEKTIVGKTGLGQWLKTLAMGRVRAGNNTMTWEHVIRAASWMKSHEDPKRRFVNTEETVVVKKEN